MKRPPRPSGDPTPHPTGVEAIVAEPEPVPLPNGLSGPELERALSELPRKFPAMAATEHRKQARSIAQRTLLERHKAELDLLYTQALESLTRKEAP